MDFFHVLRRSWLFYMLETFFQFYRNWCVFGEGGWDRLPLLDDELLALKKLVSSWGLLDCSSLSSHISSQRRAICCVKRSVTALICWATSLEVTGLLDYFSISWSDIVLGVSFLILPVLALLSIPSISVLTVFFISWEKQS